MKARKLCSLATGFILSVTTQSGFADGSDPGWQSMNKRAHGEYHDGDREKRSVFGNKDLRGTYATSFEGEVVGAGSIASVGWINPDGKGNIPRAVRVISVGGIPVPSSVFTCTYSVRPEGTGSAECATDEPAPGFPNTETFEFVLEDQGRAFRFVGTTPGVVVLGTARRQ